MPGTPLAEMKRIKCWLLHRWVDWTDEFEASHWDNEGHLRNWYRFTKCCRCALLWSAR